MPVTVRAAVAADVAQLAEVAAVTGVNEENMRANRFYGKQGFERVGTKHFRLGEHIEDDFVLERPL